MTKKCKHKWMQAHQVWSGRGEDAKAAVIGRVCTACHDFEVGIVRRWVKGTKLNTRPGMASAVLAELGY